jgi:hypothetical protein
MINSLVTEFHEKVVKQSVHEFNSSVTNIKKKKNTSGYRIGIMNRRASILHANTQKGETIATSLSFKEVIEVSELQYQLRTYPSLQYQSKTYSSLQYH